MEENKRPVVIENTKFIFMTNFSGDPERSGKYASTQRTANIIIPDEELANDLRDEGFKVKQTRPRDGEEDDFVPTYFVTIKVNYNVKYPPVIKLVSGDSNPVTLDEDTIDTLDHIRIDKVNVVLNKRFTDMGNTLWVRTMYVWQDVDDDPWAKMFAGKSEEDDCLPF